ncbi:MFS transporter [Bartonella sp. DGB2]|uniref:MFS transporter n=1 Tax=Bartonella sp. DGB2 TaxID=3388426 RepID=UPI00398F94C5
MGKVNGQQGVLGSLPGRRIFSALTILDQNKLTGQILAGYVGTLGLGPLMLLPVLVYAYDVPLGFGADIAGYIASAGVLGLAIASILVSVRTRHWDMGYVSVIGMLIMLIFTLFSIFFQGLVVLYIYSFMAGFGGGLAQAAVAAALARTVRFERAFAIFSALQFFYPGIGTFFFLRLLDQESGWFHGFIGMQWLQVIATVSALLCAPVMSAFKNKPNADPKEATSEGGNLEIKALLTAGAILSNIGMCIYGASNGAIFAYSEGIGNSAGLDPSEIGDILGYANFVAGFAALGVAAVGNRFGHYRPLIIGIFFQLFSAFVLYYYVSGIGYMAGMFIFSIAWAVVFPYFLSIQSQLDETGSVVTFGQFANLFGATVGPAVAAFWVGSESNYVAAIWVAVVFTILCILPMLAIKIFRTDT